MVSMFLVIPSEKEGAASGLINQSRQIGAPLAVVMISFLGYKDASAFEDISNTGLCLGVTLCAVTLLAGLFFYLKSVKI